MRRSNDYLQLVIKPLIEVLKTSNKEIIITCGKNAQSDVKLIVGESAKVTTFSQDTFIKKVFSHMIHQVKIIFKD